MTDGVDWYCYHEDVVWGPVTIDEIREAIDDGRLPGDTPVYGPTTDGWRAASDVLDRPSGQDWAFDDDFIAGALVSEPSADELARETARRWREARLESLLEEEAAREVSELRARVVPLGRVRRRRRAKAVVGWTVVMALGASVVVISRRGGGGEDGSVARGSPLDGDPTARFHSPDRSRPTPASAPSDKPLGQPLPLPTESGRYKFLAMQPRTDRPVAYDPCRPIRYVVNPAHEPPGGRQWLVEAIERVSAATGLVFEAEGETAEPPVEDRQPFQLDRYGDRWAPLVIWWTTPEEYPLLAGSVAGVGGSVGIEQADGPSPRSVYVSGSVALDGPALAEIASRSPAGAAGARSVIMHELGHVVGLDHVADPTQIMNPEGSGQVTEFAAGDLRGFRELGTGDCWERL